MRRRFHISHPVWAAVLALFVSTAVSTAHPVAAAPGPETRQSINTTRSLSSEYSADGSAADPLHEQATAALTAAERAHDAAATPTGELSDHAARAKY